MNMGAMYHQMGDLEEKSADRFQRWMVAEAALEVALEASIANDRLLKEVDEYQQEHGYGLPEVLESRLGKDAGPGAGASINDPAMVLRDEERERARAWAYDEVGKEGNDEEQLRRRRLAARGGDPGPLPSHFESKESRKLVAATMQGHGRTDTALIKTHLAVVRCQLTGPRQGEKLAREALADLEAVLGPSHALVATALNNLGYILKKKKDFAGSEQAYRRVLEYREARYQPKHADLLMARANLFQMYKEWGRMDQAIVQRAAILEAYGEEDPILKAQEEWMASRDERIRAERAAAERGETSVAEVEKGGGKGLVPQGDGGRGGAGEGEKSVFGGPKVRPVDVRSLAQGP